MSARRRDEEINVLACLVARLAARCWSQLGTEESADIQTVADEVGSSARKRLLAVRPGKKRRRTT